MDLLFVGIRLTQTQSDNAYTTLVLKESILSHFLFNNLFDFDLVLILDELPKKTSDGIRPAVNISRVLDADERKRAELSEYLDTELASHALVGHHSVAVLDTRHSRELALVELNFI